MSDRPRPVELVERCLTRYTAGLSFADPSALTREAERLATLPTTPAVTRMRDAVAAEQTRRVAPAVSDLSIPHAALRGPDVIARSPGERVSCAPSEVAA